MRTQIVTLFVGAAVLFSFFLLPSRAAANGPITSLTVVVKTHSDFFSGTDNSVYLWLEVEGQERIERHLNDPNRDDFERGNKDTFEVDGFLIPETCKLQRIGIHKARDNWNGGWKLASLTLKAGGETLHSESGINIWLEDNHRTWWATYVPDPCPPPVTLPPPPPVCTAPVTICRPLNPGEKDIAIDTDCDGIPDECDAELTPLKDTDLDGIPDVHEDYDGDGQIGPCESDPSNPDTDGDGILDGYEDQDNDGLPDWYEDINRNCQRDSGELDPNNADTNGDGTPDSEEDQDHDGILDWLEANFGTATNSPDTDRDGWYDGARNVATELYLIKVETDNVQEDAVWDIVDWFADEVFVTFNHARWPVDEDLDGYWNMQSGSPIGADIKAAHRIWSPRHQNPAPVYSVRMDLREDDWFDWTDDDFTLDRDITFGAQNELLVVLVTPPEGGDGYSYTLTFVVINTWFADPHPADADMDSDRDGLSEAQEFEVSDMLNGVADLFTPDIFMELDWQAGQEPKRYSKEDITSRFTYHGYGFHLDDGVFGGGGEVTPFSDVDEGVSLSGSPPSLEQYRDTYFDVIQREGIFRYALAVENVEPGCGKSEGLTKNEQGQNLCGRGDMLIFEDADFMNLISDMEPITWMHEFGHNLGLCHLPGDPSPIVTGPGGEGGCDCCPRVASSQCNCTHYSSSRWSDSAMGSGFSFPFVDDAYQALDREVDYGSDEWRVIDLTPISGVAHPVMCPP